MVPTNEKRKRCLEEMGKPTRIYLIRHGEVVNHHEGRYNGFNDVDITEEGVKQMRSVAERLNGQRFLLFIAATLSGHIGVQRL